MRELSITTWASVFRNRKSLPLKISFFGDLSDWAFDDVMNPRKHKISIVFPVKLIAFFKIILD
ncbi:hypothetical protein DHC50_20535 [Arenibacter sp. A80]|nr:hypothetical protein [Arenibacter sp. A80]RFT54381.1 hypothetical protein D0S24_20530 [Arenibacter sp. P308M17]